MAPGGSRPSHYPLPSITHPVQFAIYLPVLVGGARGVAHIPIPALIGVSLRVVRRVHTVVARVPEIVAVRVSLTQVGDGRAVV